MINKLHSSTVNTGKSGVLTGSIKKLTKIKGSGNGNPSGNAMVYEESIDVTKKDGWLIRIKNGASDSLAFAVGDNMGESIIKPHKLDESKDIFNLNMNKDFTKRIRKVDVERQQLEMKKYNETQGQGAALYDSKNHYRSLEK